ncbi:hypothetical protein IV102_33755 [bacterium]|nr:hypothetical protein [bacterium]
MRKRALSLPEVLLATFLFAIVASLGTQALVLASRRLPRLTRELLALEQHARFVTQLESDLSSTPAAGLSLVEQRLGLTPVVGVNPVDQGLQWQVTGLLLYEERQGQVVRCHYAQIKDPLQGDRPVCFAGEELRDWLSGQSPETSRVLAQCDEWRLAALEEHLCGFQLTLRTGSIQLSRRFAPNLELGL